MIEILFLYIMVAFNVCFRFKLTGDAKVIAKK